MSKKKFFRLEDGTEVTAGITIFRAYQSKRNKERYMNRKRNQYVTRSLDDEWAYNLEAPDNVEEEIDKRLRLEKLRSAIKKLSKTEQRLIKEYFFDDLSLRAIAEQHGVSHMKIYNNINNILKKLKDYIINNDT